jgi:hypothetical protein
VEEDEMWKDDIRLGCEYAIREKRSGPFQRVKVLENVRGTKWKVRWIDPNPGLVDYIRSQTFVVPWKELKGLLKDEERERRLVDYNKAQGFTEGSSLALALDTVFDAAHDGGTETDKASLKRLKSRVGLEGAKPSPATYEDRFGILHLGVDEALALAKAFCVKEPATVLVNIDVQENKWEREAREEGRDHLLGFLNEYRAAWALVRQWTGHDAAVANWRHRVTRLERLVWDAVYALQRAGQDAEAEKLRRALQRVSVVVAAA